MTYADRFDSLFQYYAEMFNQDWRDLKAQAIAESGMNPNVRSGAGAAGLMQFMSPTFVEWSDRLHLGNTANPYNPEHSIHCAAAYMRWLIDRYNGNLTKAQAAYNWGIGHVDHSEWEKYPDETKNYVQRIKNYRLAMA